MSRSTCLTMNLFVRLALVCGGLVCGAAPALAAGDEPTQRYVLLVAANDGGKERVKLRYAATDAQALGEVLVQMGGVPEGNTELVAEPSPSELTDAIAKLEKKIAAQNAKGRRTELLFYYSGHSDERGLLLGENRYGYRSLRRKLDKIPADVRLIILDSCSSGALTRTKGGKRAPAFLTDQASEVKGHAILTSSSQDEAAQESDAIGASFFTHFLVSGLRGAADASGDRRVTLNEAYRYAFDETLARTQNTRGGAQHAAYDIQMTGHGDLVLTELQKTNATLVIDEKLTGRVWVRTRDNRLVAEVTKHAGRALELGLASGAYKVQLAAHGKAYAADVSLTKGKKATVGADAFEMIGTEETVLRGDVSPARPEPIFFGIDFAPGVGTSSVAPDRPRKISFNIVGGMSGGTEWFELAPALNIDNGPVSGVQIAGALNLDTDEVNGVQVAGGLNLNRGTTRGVQFAGGVNVVPDFAGVQFAGGLNLATGDVAGVQVAPANFARKLDGLQLGVLNISEGHVDGLQLGVINIAPTADAGVGLLGIYWDGFVQPEAVGNSEGIMFTGIRHGGGPFYNVYYVGTRALVDGGGPLAYALGFGWHTQLGERFEFATDLTFGNVLGEGGDWRAQGSLASLRPTLSYAVFDGVTVFGGPTANLMLSTGDADRDPTTWAPTVAWELTDSDAANRVALWPGFTAGLRFF
ncbi:caspase family protein [Persicimonas caeni]|uniref:Caspase family protein n=1 Tax=Persicimonas caeni TaxID=2292766 RepID=A0A4Y6PNU3_PERCE|nr:caspase family protein [Persicimonas caeni]QDG49475.1 caspase family protein [Persicimonas caeni]QED30696.1 caspase family protein [Persicimonas caeni]